MGNAQNSLKQNSINWWQRLVLLGGMVLAVVIVSVTNRYLTTSFTKTTRNQAERRLTLYSSNLLSELRQHAIVPQLLARDPELIRALSLADYSRSTQRLITLVREIGAASLVLLDKDGRIVAATNRNRLGQNQGTETYFVDALRGQGTIFTSKVSDTSGFVFTYSRRIQSAGQVLGVIAVEVDLHKFELAWAGISDAIIVTNSEGDIILATEPRWRGRTEAQALVRQNPQTAIERAIRVTADWGVTPHDAYLQGEAVMRLENRIPFRGWRMVSFTTYSSVRERVNGVLALEIMAFSLLLTFAFYYLNRRATLRMALFQRESKELRALNIRLQQEIAKRERVQETLAVAEQTLEQSSKLAALGEMSAAVSHELNQPLAAMKTYLAGARLLLGRNRPDEALSSFARIDDLIERMSAITRQLKFYARKGSEELSAVDMGQALAFALSMMEPQLRQRKVQISRFIPEEKIEVLGDRMRIEQVLINLLRNALDATKSERKPHIEIMLVAGEEVTLTVRDNGPGIEDAEQLFEPFYTTKQAGEGVGLGLAISSCIVNDLGGRLTARNSKAGGAIFEMRLPGLQQEDSFDQPPAGQELSAINE